MRRPAALLALLLSLLPACRRDPGLPPAAPEESFALRRGRLIHRRSCAPCHGGREEGDGLAWPDYMEGRPPDLPAIDPARLEAWRRGRLGGCPDWRGVYRGRRLDDLLVYIRRRAGEEGR